MRVLYFGVYNPEYARNWVLINGLKRNGVHVVELRRKPERMSLVKLFFDYLKLKEDYDIMVVGFPGQEVMFLAKLLTKKPIIFDCFTSHYGGYILDRQKYSVKSLMASYYKFLDKWSCKLADVALLDTNAHIDFFVREFKLSRAKFMRVFVGTDSGIFYPRETAKSTDKFLIHFHGHYIPLQGVKYIIEAAKILESENAHFNIIGNGQTFENDLKLAERLNIKNISFLSPVSYNELPLMMAKADICLGIFGDSSKTDLVIPNKVYEAMAMGKPIITADTPAVRELLTDKENVLFCGKADAKDLAEKIKLLKHSPDLRDIVGKRAWQLFEDKLTEISLVSGLLQDINEKRILSK